MRSDPSARRQFAVGAVLLAAALLISACSSQSASGGAQGGESSGPGLAAKTGRGRPMRQFPTEQLTTATFASAKKSATPKPSAKSTNSSVTGKATIRQVDTTVGGATETGADLIVGQIVPAPTGFAGESLVQDGCSGSTSNNPILVTNNTSSTQSFYYNAQPSLQANGLLMLSNPPYLQPGATQTNMCTITYEEGWVMNTGDTLTVEPGMTGVAYALIGGAAYTGGSRAWLTMGASGGGWYQFEVQLDSPTQGFYSLEMPGNDGPHGAMGNWIEDGPVGANLVNCGTNPGGGAYPDASSIIVNGDVPGNWASPGQNSNSGEGPTYTFNQPICFASPHGT